MLFPASKNAGKQIDKCRKSLWRGNDLQSKTTSKAAWQMVSVPKVRGGLRVLNLQTQNQSLLLKNLHKFYNKADLPWVHSLELLLFKWKVTPG